ncbi:MAG TPA: transglutaminase-like domain-containing protein, partial [Candidatus Eisenbergiella stercorigallinarum]|nr:transglutaminase-like domain-containing protein [Candidatus Eisenbergiella stercorigallinarum]
QPPHIRFTPYLRALTAEVVGKELNPLKKAERIYYFITSQVSYSYMPEYFLLDDIAETCAVSRKGDCGVQALLFITMCRIARIPARWQSGLSVTPASVGPHDWAQFFIPPYGWLYADLSFGGSAFRAGQKERQAFYFGNLDPFRMAANTAFQAPLFPLKAGLRADPYDNQVGECEIDGKGLLTGQFDFFHEIIDLRSIRQ